LVFNRPKALTDSNPEEFVTKSYYGQNFFRVELANAVPLQTEKLADNVTKFSPSFLQDIFSNVSPKLGRTLMVHQQVDLELRQFPMGRAQSAF
jgi:hypothetical protein